MRSCKRSEKYWTRMIVIMNNVISFYYYVFMVTQMMTL